MNFAPNDSAVALEPEEQFDAYAKRDPRAGQGTAEHAVDLTFLSAAAPDKCWRVAFTLHEIAEVICSDMAIDGNRLTAVTLSDAGAFTGFVINHRGVFGFDAAIEALERWNVRGIVFAPPDEDGWHALIPLSGPRELDVFEIFAARVYGLFAGKLDPMLFEPGHTVTIGGVRHLQVVNGEFLDRADRTYAGSIFRDGSTVRSRSSGCPAGDVHSPLQRADRAGPALLRPAAGALRAAVAAAIKAYEKSGKMLDAALAYAAHGIPIFPVTVDKIPVPPRNKDANGKPIPGTGSFKKATTDEAQIRAWWRRAEHLIGLPMGRASGVCCIDVDTSEDHADGVAEWAKITAQHEPIVTREHRSATGGPHLIFDFGQPIGCSTGDLPAGIEVKGQGSYIVVPPSVRKGRAYTVHNDIDPGPLPAWLYDLVSAGQSRSSGEPFRGEVTADAVELAGALAAIPNTNVSWDDWKAMGLRLYASLGPAGFILFDQWSQKSGKYDAENTAEAREQIEASPPDRTGAGAIFKRARQHGWAPKLAECAPTYPAADGDSAAARHEIKERIGAFWANAEAWHVQRAGLTKQERSQDLPPVEAIRIETGLGKTEQAIADVAAGGRQGLVYTVDRHLLGDKIEERLAAVGVSAKVFRGRGADDPLNPGRQMCLDLARVKLAMKLHADVSSTCYIQRRNGLVCPLFARCGYQRQPMGATPDVWVTAHDMLFHVQNVFGKPKAVIIDERMWSKGIRGIEHEEGDIEWTVPLDSLIKDAASTDWRVSSRAYHRKALGAALASQADNGGVERWHLAAHLTAMQCTEAIHLEWATMPEVGMHPGMSAAAIRRLGERKDLIDAVQHSRKVIRVLEEVRDLLRNRNIAVSGRLTLKQSNGQRVVEWRGVAKISKQFQAPTLLLDATLPEPPVLQVYHPQAEVAADIRVALPNSVKVRQVLGAPTSSRKLDAVEYLDSVRRYILQRWLETGRGPTLVICQQKVCNSAACQKTLRLCTTTTSPGWTISKR